MMIEGNSLVFVVEFQSLVRFISNNLSVIPSFQSELAQVSGVSNCLVFRLSGCFVRWWVQDETQNTTFTSFPFHNCEGMVMV